MAGKSLLLVAVVCAVFSISKLALAQPPYFPRSNAWLAPNEIIHGIGGPLLRPLPGVLIAGQMPSVPRPTSVRMTTGPRHFRPMPPTQSPWPTQGPQIQRAKETSHWEYEVLPQMVNKPKPKPPTVLRPAASRMRPLISGGPEMPPEMLRFLAEDVRPRPTLARPQSRTDRPPMMMLPTQRSTADPDFQEGFRILSDLFMEDAGSDIRQNLVGGSEISFNGAYYPISNLDEASLVGQQQQQRQTAPAPTTTQMPTPPPTPRMMEMKPRPNKTSTMTMGMKKPEMQIMPAKEQPLIGLSSNQKAKLEPAPMPTPTPASSTQMETAEGSFGPHQYHTLPPPSHSSSFMFTDPNEGQGEYATIHDGGYTGPPPPPFHLGGNTLAPKPHSIRPLRPNNQNEQGKSAAPQGQSSDKGGYNSGDNSLTSSDGSDLSQSPFMMMPIAPLLNAAAASNEPLPSSDEVQQALSILARYASKQAQQMGGKPGMMNMQLQMTSQSQENSPPSDSYGPPSDSYGPPSQEQQQTSTMPTFMSAAGQDGGATPARSQLPGPSMSYSAPEMDATTTTASSTGQTDESSPFPVYGPPTSFSLGGGYEGGYGNGGGGGGAGGPGGIIGAKVEALKTIGSAVTGGFKSITGLKAGILNAGLNVIGNLGRAKGDITNSLKIPVLPQKEPSPIYGAPVSEAPAYGPPSVEYGVPQTTPVADLLNGVKNVVAGVAGTITQTGKAGVGIGLSSGQFVKNHFAIKGQGFTETVSRKLENQNQYFQNVLKHVQSIFDAATARPLTGKKNQW